MPYLSWTEAGVLHRHLLDGDLALGRDPACLVNQPQDPSVSRKHASISLFDGRWWLRDLGSHNGTFLNGLATTLPGGGALSDGDEVQLGDWRLTFTEGFPGLDGVDFIERVGDLFAEVRPEPAQAMVLIRGLELLHRSTEILLHESSSQGMLQSILE